MRTHLHERNLYRRNRHLLVMSPEPRLKGINRVRKRLADGTVAIYYYHRATGTRLLGDPRSADFLIAYTDAEKITPKDTGTVAGLIRKYLGSLKFERKRETTKREYRRILIRTPVD